MSFFFRCIALLWALGQTGFKNSRCGMRGKLVLVVLNSHSRLGLAVTDYVYNPFLPSYVHKVAFYGPITLSQRKTPGLYFDTEFLSFRTNQYLRM